MLDFLAGAVTVGYALAAVFFLRFWHKTQDRLFLVFSIAFALFALNQALAAMMTVVYESASWIYALRLLGFVLILAAIVDKNRPRPRRRL
jgi:hypothetical protein